MKESSYDDLKRKRRSSLESLILTAIVFFLLFSVNANSQGLGVLEVSKNEMYCQVLNSDFECQLIDNQLSVSIGGYVENLEADLDLTCGEEEVKTYAGECIRTENLYKCYFDIEPTITLGSPKECEMTFYFYKKFFDESIGSDKYEGSLKIIPLFETSMLNLEKQKTKLKVASTSREKIWIFIQQHISHYCDNMHESRLILHESHNLPKNYWKIIRDKQSEYFHLLKSIVEDLFNNRDINAEEVKIITWSLLGMCNWPYQWYEPKGPISPEELAEEIYRIFIGDLPIE